MGTFKAFFHSIFHTLFYPIQCFRRAFKTQSNNQDGGFLRK